MIERKIIIIVVKKERKRNDRIFKSTHNGTTPQ